ncbi:MAG: tRNA (adenosine(37)-N6)-dimethylallyltransferase MiaA [Clostridia bacterium]|nr:tRNA (adenosine(37)-N6)-dimethylallyltransferase MiaA [Clostridia bacterium]
MVVIFGPTASGKSDLAVKVARELNGEVVTADSMQVYKRMNIGTAKPTIEEMQGIKHHMIDVAEPTENYSLARYIKEAECVIQKVWSNGKIPVLAGGTGLYIDTLINGTVLSETDCDQEYRKSLYDLAQEKGNDYVYDLLKKVDLQSAESIHPNNLKRVIRALEFYKTSGIRQSEHIKKAEMVNSPYKVFKFGTLTERENLYNKINLRVDKMLENGLVNEVDELRADGIDGKYTSMQAIGYKEVLEYLNGNISYEEMSELIKKSTRNYAKRQITWFKREQNTTWIDVSDKKIIEMFKKTMEL